MMLELFILVHFRLQIVELQIFIVLMDQLMPRDEVASGCLACLLSTEKKHNNFLFIDLF